MPGVAASAMFENAIVSSIFARAPVLHFWRDIHSIAPHIVANDEVGMRNYGRYRVGQEPMPSIYQRDY